MANINVIDPDGDVIFICGETELQVSSKVLSLASPVFKALFSPNFAEGQPTSSKTIHIHLHDDVESLRFLCAILHHKCTSANGIGLERLEKLAVVTDKYDVCFRAVFVLTDTLFWSQNVCWEWWELAGHPNPTEFFVPRVTATMKTR